jgi:hypothetical protein
VFRKLKEKMTTQTLWQRLQMMNLVAASSLSAMMPGAFAAAAAAAGSRTTTNLSLLSLEAKKREDARSYIAEADAAKRGGENEDEEEATASIGQKLTTSSTSKPTESSLACSRQPKR